MSAAQITVLQGACNCNRRLTERYTIPKNVGATHSCESFTQAAEKGLHFLLGGLFPD